VSYLPQKTVHGSGPVNPLYAGAQRNYRQGKKASKPKKKWHSLIKIDNFQVPNSLPNRSNVEIEIYGMEGIPANDIKEHEKQKNGNKSDSDDDEPASKKAKPESKVTNTLILRIFTNWVCPKFQHRPT
jgi:hypothetical protein